MPRASGQKRQASSNFRHGHDIRAALAYFQRLSVLVVHSGVPGSLHAPTSSRPSSTLPRALAQMSFQPMYKLPTGLAEGPQGLVGSRISAAWMGRLTGPMAADTNPLAVILFSGRQCLGRLSCYHLPTERMVASNHLRCCRWSIRTRDITQMAWERSEARWVSHIPQCGELPGWLPRLHNPCLTGTRCSRLKPGPPQL